MEKQQINIYLQKDLLEKINKRCEKEYKKRSVWIRDVIVKALNI